MNKLFIIQIVCFISLSFFSQNLINNGSFEEYLNCPEGSFNDCVNWINPTDATPDFYHNCSVNFVPYIGLFNFQFPNSGGGLVGLYLIKTEHGGIQVNNIREYIQCVLKYPLISNKCYLFSMYMNLSNNSVFCTNNISCFYSQAQILLTGLDNYLFDQNPQIKFKKIIKDTLNWVKISGIYKAIGNEEYLTIGNFNNDSLTNIENFQFNNNFNQKSAYYFIDDVSVIPIDSLPNGLPAFAGNDTLITPGDSIFIGQDIINLNCKWSILETGEIIADSISGIYVTPLETTSYLVEQELCGLITYDTVTIFIDDAGLEQQNLTNYNIMISPNPSNGEIFIEANENLEIKIYDIQGRKIFFEIEKIEENLFKIILNCDNGIYNINIESNNEIKVKKIQILR
jgi:hypothetical protein